MIEIPNFDMSVIGGGGKPRSVRKKGHVVYRKVVAGKSLLERKTPKSIDVDSVFRGYGQARPVWTEAKHLGGSSEFAAVDFVFWAPGLPDAEDPAIKIILALLH